MDDELYDEYAQLPWHWGSDGQGSYGDIGLAYSDIQRRKDNISAAYQNFGNIPWYRSKKKVNNQLLDFNSQLEGLNGSIAQYNKDIKAMGLEGVAPKVEDFSKSTMEQVMKSASEQAAESKAASMRNTANIAGMAFDIGKNVLNDNRSTYDGKYGHLTQSIDAAGDGFANAALASGNPYAMMAGAAYKGMSMLNQVIGNSTDGMTKTDALLDSNLGFALLPGVGKLNAAFGSTTDKFEVDQDIQSTLGNSYHDTYDDLNDAASVAGKRYGVFSGRARRRAQSAIQLAEQRQNMLSNISATAQDRSAAGYYEGTGFRNAMNLRGGYQSVHAARKGIKLNLDFAHKVAKAQRGQILNTYTPVKPDDVQTQGFIKNDLPTIVPGYAKSAYASMDPVNLEASGIHFDKYDGDKIVFRVDSQELFDRLANDPLWKKQIMELYQVSGVDIIGPEKLNTPPADEESPTPPANPTLPPQENQPAIDVEDEGGTGEVDEEVNEEVEQGTGEEEGTPTAPSVQVPDLEWQLNFIGFTEKEQEDFYKCVAQIRRDPTSIGLSSMHALANEILHIMQNDDPTENNRTFYYGDPESGKRIEYVKRTQGNAPINGKSSGEVNIITDDQVITQKKGGIFTFMPYTDEQVNKFKAGGSFNVIPEGALHKNKHHMEGAEGLTKKGIPVVTEEDGKKVQQAEIEVNEIIFRLEVTEKLEKLAKEGTDEAALEAGKLLTDEILHNTHDNTGLIKETV